MAAVLRTSEHLHRCLSTLGRSTHPNAGFYHLFKKVRLIGFGLDLGLGLGSGVGVGVRLLSPLQEGAGCSHRYVCSHPHLS